MSRQQRTLWTPLKYFYAVLAIVFVGEAGVMYLLPLFLSPDVNQNIEAFCDAALLTLITAPVLWALLIRPLREVASDESRKYAAMIAESRDGILTLGEQGLIETANAQIEAYFDVDETGLVGKPLTALLPEFGRGVGLCESLNDRLAGAGKQFSEEEIVLFKDNCERCFEVCISSLTIRSRRQYTVMIRETTERKRVEKSLFDANQSLIEIAHRAGKAEVATCVIHNVGNVLTNVNVLATSVTAKIQHSRVSGLAKGAELLQSHQHDLASFLMEDKRGKQLPGYFLELSKCWERESKDLLDDLFALTENLQHANKIVDAQQDFAGSSAIIESTSMVDLLNKGLSITVAGLERHGIDVETQFEDLPMVSLDRHKALQVLVNLLTNAKEAFEGIPDTHNKTIVLRLLSNAPERFRIEVADNGSGIATDDVTRIFSNGFTTKADGHGFGLHYSSLAVKEMGGTLSVRSEGRGLGATFVVDLPLVSVMAAVTS
jgi:PAS domain S-box-containing protein